MLRFYIKNFNYEGIFFGFLNSGTGKIWGILVLKTIFSIVEKPLVLGRGHSENMLGGEKGGD